MTMPTPHPQMPAPGRTAAMPGPRPGMPLPGQHLAAANQEFADPERVKADVDALLAELSAGAPNPGFPGAPTVHSEGTDIVRRAKILEQAHDVLVQALATVDKI
ncbi:hypothetical protein VMT65_30310 [Nocardia sp. CDC153]|uniref:hypothetical protein n=1 Tax=Nocardia sp. CDC153 TaxID=3112167 RepID=UPI002DBF5A04|nr:hypothetical protein [Nocardia sp. CDC153]MEC3957360.1 hypothetical protein [Nocardia sp. CDC153]